MVALAPVLQEYFTAYLITQRAMSGATIRTYRDTWKLFLGFLSQTVHVPVHQLQTTDIDASCRPSRCLTMTTSWSVTMGRGGKAPPGWSGGAWVVMVTWRSSFVTRGLFAVLGDR